MVNGLSNEINDVVGGGFCKTLDSKWKADVFPFYLRAIRGRYPLNRKATADIALSDFGAFFGPGGIIDQYVNTYLVSNVAKAKDQWEWIGKGAVCLSNNSLQQFALADDIKSTYFTPSGNTPSFQFDVVAHNITMESIDELTLDIGSKRMEYAHGPAKGSTAFIWPPADGNTTVNLRVLPIIPGSSSILVHGPWAILKLMDQGKKSIRGNNVKVRYNFGGRPVTLPVTTSSFNPFNSTAVRRFRAPESL